MPNCPNCGSTNTKRNGLSISLIAQKQRYKCMECGHRFTESDDPAEGAMPSVLVMDIETLPIVAYTWGTWDVNINKEQIIKDWAVLSWSAKWLDDPRMMSDILTPAEIAKRDDKRIVKSLWQLFDDADVIIAQNGRKFDLPKMNTRFWIYRMPRPSSYKIIDTLDCAKRAFSMTYNSLDYLGEYLGLGRKLKTDFQLWIDCDNGDKDALARMREYNENDVTLLEEVYLRMRPYIPNHPSYAIYDKIVGVCPVCLDPNITEIGLYTANVRQYPEFRCGKCGSLWHSTKYVK